MAAYTNIVNKYIETHVCWFEGIIDHTKGYKIVRETFKQAVLALCQEFEKCRGYQFIKVTPWSFTHKSAKVCCQVQFFNHKTGKIINKNINIIGLRWHDLLCP